MRWIAVSLLSIALATLAAPVPTPITCATGQITWLSGNGTPRMPLLISFAHRPVGGGSVNAAGHWSLPLQVGQERPGYYPIEVRARGSGALIAAFECAVGVALPTRAPTAPATSTPAVITPTPNPLNTGGEDQYDCPDFTTWQDANAVFQANQPGDPNGLDGEGNGIPCEDLPGAPVP